MAETKKYTLQFTEQEVATLIQMIQNENVEPVQRVMDGQARIDTINKLTNVVQEDKLNANNKPENKKG